MPEKKTSVDETVAPAPTNDFAALAQAIVTAVRESQPAAAPGVNVADMVEALKALQPVRQLTIDEFLPRSPFNPTGKKKRELPMPLYQNGVRVNAELLHDEEHALVRLLKPGRFVNGLITVSENDASGVKSMHINYKNGTPDQRNAIKDECRNFTEILKRCVSEGSGVALA